MLMENDSVVLKLHLHVDEKLVPTFILALVIT